MVYSSSFLFFFFFLFFGSFKGEKSARLDQIIQFQLLLTMTSDSFNPHEGMTGDEVNPHGEQPPIEQAPAEQAEPLDKPVANEFEIYNQALNMRQLPIFTRLQLLQYNGIIRPECYVAIKGFIYDVSNNTKSYGPGKAYHKLVGKDVSRLLALNKLNLSKQSGSPNGGEWWVNPFHKENTWYIDDLNEKQHGLVDKWIGFFKKRYKIVGIIVDHEFLLSMN